MYTNTWSRWKTLVDNSVLQIWISEVLDPPLSRRRRSGPVQSLSSSGCATWHLFAFCSNRLSDVSWTTRNLLVNDPFQYSAKPRFTENVCFADFAVCSAVSLCVGSAFLIVWSALLLLRMHCCRECTVDNDQRRVIDTARQPENNATRPTKNWRHRCLVNAARPVVVDGNNKP